MVILTPQGRGAIGVVCVWGSGAIDAVDTAFHPARLDGLRTTPPARLRLGRMGREPGDEVVAVVLPGAHTPTVEIQCHGGAATVGLIVDALQAAGVRLVEPTVWAGENSGSRIQAEALIDLGSALTLRAAEILLEQAQGALDRELEHLIETICRDETPAAEVLDRLINRGRIGTRLKNGWRVVIAGRPNVGKSTLLNALAGYQRAIVHSAPGTTRDVVNVATALDGWPVEIVDTAGLRSTCDPIEQSGIERAMREAVTADLVLKVLDRSEPLRVGDQALVAREGPALLVASKCDLPAAWAHDDLAAPEVGILNVSAERGDGLDLLAAAIVAAIVPCVPEPGCGVPFRPAHLDGLVRARESLRSGAPETAIREIHDVYGTAGSLDSITNRPGGHRESG
jgi:tRNA modification GTPase